jgi:WD40 repeat protein
MSAQTLKQIATIDLPGPSGQRFDYLTLQGHTGWVWKATFSPDRKLIATASEDQTARIWQALTLEDISRILVK